MDSDPHLKSSWIQNRIKKNCWIRIRKKTNADPSVADPDPWDSDPYQKMAGSGSVSNDTDPDPTKTIENIK